MGTIYNIPVTWSKNPMPSYKECESYKGVINLTYGIGNEIVGTWGKVEGSGTTRYDEITLYWNWLEVNAAFTQGGETANIKDYRSGRYYPNGQKYNYSINLNKPLILADNYSIIVTDNQCMFDTDTLTVPSTIPLDVTSIKVEKPTNFTMAGQAIYEDITVAFDMISTNKIDYQVIQSNKILLEKNNAIEKKILIPAGTITSTNTVTVKVRTHFNFAGVELYGEWVSYTLTGLYALQAETPQNVRILGTERAIEEYLDFAWDTVDPRCKATVEIWQDGAKVTEQHTISGTTYKLQAGTLKNTSAIKIRVKNVLTVNGYVATSSYGEVTVNNLISVMPVITDFTLDSLNRDYIINVSVNAKNAERFEVYRENTLISSNTLSPIELLEGKLNKGTNRIKVIAYNQTSAGLLKTELMKNFSIVQDEPAIYSLEPADINININELSNVSFVTNDFCNRWEVSIDGTKFNGTEERSIKIMPNFFKKGTNKITLVSYYSPSWSSSEVRTATKEVTFNGYGVPQTPVFDNTTVYNMAYPTIKWSFNSQESDAQITYNLKIVNAATNETVEEVTLLGSNIEYIPENALTNNTTYLLMIRIENKFSLWSEYGTKTITTSFNNLPKPTLILTQNGDNVLVTVENIKFETFQETRVLRKEEDGQWLEIADALDATDYIIDYMCMPKSQIYYKARVFDTAGSYVDSDEYMMIPKVKNYVLTNVTDENKTMTLDFANLQVKCNNNNVVKIFAGSSKPVVYKNNVQYETGTLTVMLENEQVNSLKTLILNGDIFVLKTWKGHRVFGSFSIDSISPINAFIQSITLTYTEVAFNEYHAYSGKREKGIVFLNGEYYLDGSIDLSGLVRGVTYEY